MSLPGVPDDEVEVIERRCNAATPGPWFVRQLDDVDAQCLVAISTIPDTGRNERFPDFDGSEIVAATLIQKPRYVDVEGARWDENAHFIANARGDIPWLIAEIRRLRALIPDG